MQWARITEPTGPRDRTGITYDACKEHKLSMHTPAPVFEHGTQEAIREQQEAKRRGWLYKTLPKTLWGKKAEKDLQPRWQPAQLVPGTKDRGTDM